MVVRSFGGLAWLVRRGVARRVFAAGHETNNNGFGFGCRDRPIRSDQIRSDRETKSKESSQVRSGERLGQDKRAREGRGGEEGTRSLTSPPPWCFPSFVSCSFSCSRAWVAGGLGGLEDKIKLNHDGVIDCRASCLVLSFCLPVCLSVYCCVRSAN